jgi:hypothetical protein
VTDAADGEEAAAGEIHLRADDPTPVLNELTSWALERGIQLSELEVRQPSLEDTYLELTDARVGEASE